MVSACQKLVNFREEKSGRLSWETIMIVPSLNSPELLIKKEKQHKLLTSIFVFVGGKKKIIAVAY